MVLRPWTPISVVARRSRKEVGGVSSRSDDRRRGGVRGDRAPTVSVRGFPIEEFQGRLARAQAAMAEQEVAALLLTTEPDVRYFTGFLTRFWESPTRPWFVVVPAAGEPVAVIPTIGAHLMSTCWVRDVRTWSSPNYEDDGVGLLAEVLRETTPPGARIGAPSGPETHLRMPLESWARLAGALDGRRLGADAGIMRRLRMIKSEREIAKIRHACAIAGRAFDRVAECARAGAQLDAVFRRFQALCLEEGADWVSYLAGAAGAGGYGDVISPAREEPLVEGDVLMLDTGVVWDGYFCDFDRNYAIGARSAEAQSAYRRLLDASDAAFAMARPGVRVADLFAAMDDVLTGGSGGDGRLGHGLGMQLTEPPSLLPQEDAILEPGMTLTLEPGLALGPGRMMVHEENIVIGESGADYLSPPAPRDLPLL